MSVWQPVETIPIGQRIEALTYTGIVCEARVSTHYGHRVFIRPATPQYPKRRVHAFRTDKSGDVSVVAWRPLERR